MSGVHRYYLASWSLFFTLKKAGLSLAFPDWRVLASYVVLALVAFGISYGIFASKHRHFQEMSKKLIEYYENSPKMQHPQPASLYRVASATESFQAAPFAFPCLVTSSARFVKKHSEMIHTIAQKYRGKINVEFFFFPLDNACNPGIKRKLHPFACEASYLASCFPEEFAQVEKDIFENQSSLSFEWIRNYAKKHHVTPCMKSLQARQMVLSHIKIGHRLNITATPTMLINGIKIRGGIPLSDLSLLIDHILSKQ